MRRAKATHILVGAVGILLVLCYGAALLTPGVGLYHDDGVYLATAKALAEGKGYRIISLPIEIPQTKYPVLFPGLLALLWRVGPPFPQNLPILKLVPFAAAWVWFAVVFALLRRETANPNVALGITLLVAASPLIMFFSTILLSETLFATFVWLGLLVLHDIEHEGPTRSKVLLAALICAAAFYTRTIGFTLILGGALSLLYHRHVKAALLFGLSCALLAAPWIVWSIGQETPQADLYFYYSGEPYRDWNVVFGFSWGSKLQIFALNLLNVLVAPAHYLGLSLVHAWPIYALFGLLGAAGFVANARLRVGVIHLFLLFYLLVLLLWAWPPMRFLVPVYPLSLYFIWRGMCSVRDRVPILRSNRIVVFALLVAVFFQAGWALGRTTARAVSLGTVCTAPPCVRWAEVEELFDFVRDGVAPGAVVLTNLDPLLYLYTGHKAIRAFEPDPYALYYDMTSPSREEPFGSPDRLISRLAASGAEYIVMVPSDSPQARFLRRQIRKTMRQHPGLLDTVLEGCAGQDCVYRVSGEPESLPGGR